MPKTWSIQSNLKTEGLPYLSPRLTLRYSHSDCPAIVCQKDSKVIEYPHWGEGDLPQTNIQDGSKPKYKSQNDEVFRRIGSHSQRENYL